MADPQYLVAGAALGAISHRAYFNQGEHHMYAIRYTQLFLACCLASTILVSRLGDKSIPAALPVVISVATSFLAGIYSSLLAYRIFLHPLNKFPGPFAARISSFWYTTQVLNADAHFKLLDLHHKYGDFVRVGSSDLSIAHPQGPHAVYGPGTKCTKAYWYDNDAPLTSMHTTRDRAMHDKRRRIWSPAFSDKALRDYEGRIKPYGDKLLERLKEMQNKPINVTKWFNYFTFDTMGDLAFGESFAMLEEGKEHWAIKLLNEGMEPLHLMCMLHLCADLDFLRKLTNHQVPPWIFRILTAIPGAAAGYWQFICKIGN